MRAGSYSWRVNILGTLRAFLVWETGKCSISRSRTLNRPSMFSVHKHICHTYFEGAVWKDDKDYQTFCMHLTFCRSKLYYHKLTGKLTPFKSSDHSWELGRCKYFCNGQPWQDWPCKSLSTSGNLLWLISYRLEKKTSLIYLISQCLHTKAKCQKTQ